MNMNFMMKVLKKTNEAETVRITLEIFRVKYPPTDSNFA